MPSIPKTQTFRTDLNCGSCVAKVAPHLDADPTIRSWSVDTKDPRKPLTVTSDSLTDETLRALVRKGGFKVFERIVDATSPAAASPEKSRSWIDTYRPILLILFYLVAVVALIEWRAGAFDSVRAMRHFMGGFFLVFSFFKLLNLGKFADAYATYDVLAKRSRAYGIAYPFIELGLGLSYLAGTAPWATSVATLAVMSLSSVGVIQSLLRKRKIECACLGTVFELPMSKVTLIEDLLMVAMAIAMLGMPA